MAAFSGVWRERYGGFSIPLFCFSICFVKHTFRAMSRIGMVESTQGIILLGKIASRDFLQRLLEGSLCAHLTNPGPTGE
jgi:hypothetical protein